MASQLTCKGCFRQCLAPKREVLHVSNLKRVGDHKCVKCGNVADFMIYDMIEYMDRKKDAKLSPPIMILCETCCVRDIERCTQHDIVWMEVYNFFHFVEVNK